MPRLACIIAVLLVIISVELNLGLMTVNLDDIEHALTICFRSCATRASLSAKIDESVRDITAKLRYMKTWLPQTALVLIV